VEGEDRDIHSMSSYDSVPFADLTLTVDGRQYNVSRYALSARSKLLEALFELEEDPSEGVTEAWALAPKGECSPTFSMLLRALYTGLAEAAISVQMLDYFMTNDVTSGGVMLISRNSGSEQKWVIPPDKISDCMSHKLCMLDGRKHVDHREAAWIFNWLKSINAPLVYDGTKLSEQSGSSVSILNKHITMTYSFTWNYYPVRKDRYAKMLEFYD
jgi:hypothetical protein